MFHRSLLAPLDILSAVVFPSVCAVVLIVVLERTVSPHRSQVFYTLQVVYDHIEGFLCSQIRTRDKPRDILWSIALLNMSVPDKSGLANFDLLPYFNQLLVTSDSKDLHRSWPSILDIEWCSWILLMMSGVQLLKFQTLLQRSGE